MRHCTIPAEGDEEAGSGKKESEKFIMMQSYLAHTLNGGLGGPRLIRRTLKF